MGQSNTDYNHQLKATLTGADPRRDQGVQHTPGFSTSPLRKITLEFTPLQSSKITLSCVECFSFGARVSNFFVKECTKFFYA